MQITERQIEIDSNWFSAERDVQRSKGLHLSHVIDFIESKTYDEDKTVMHRYAVAGFWWERLLEKFINLNVWDRWDWLFSRVMVEVDNPVVIRPGEMCIDGIFLTPDGYNIETEQLEEYKYTSKSSKGGIYDNPKFRRWLQYQIPAYLHALNLTVCCLRVYFSRGDYTDGKPIWMEYTIEYQEQEIAEIWEMILLNAEAMRKAGLVDNERT